LVVRSVGLFVSLTGLRERERVSDVVKDVTPFRNGGERKENNKITTDKEVNHDAIKVS
jgi:hypothetical protein